MLAYQNNWTGSTCAGQSADFAAVWLSCFSHNRQPFRKEKHMNPLVTLRTSCRGPLLRQCAFLFVYSIYIPLCDMAVWAHLCVHTSLSVCLIDYPAASQHLYTLLSITLFWLHTHTHTHMCTSHIGVEGGPANSILATCGQAKCCVNTQGREGMSRGALSALI